MKDFLDFLQKEWNTIAAAPLSFFTFSVLAATVVYLVLSWRYEGIIQQLRERMAGKDEQIESYRERLQLVPARGSGLSRLTHGELQKEALRFVARLREWLARWNSEMAERSHSDWRASVNARNSDESQAMWDAQGANLARLSVTTVTEYEEKFKVEAIQFRDEMLTRMESPPASRADRNLYELPTNFLIMGIIASDLENLARHLE